MRDVAQRCGVAESTVSHVINGTKFVSPETRKKVLRVLQEMNYHRDSHARRLARGHSDFLGLVIYDIENPFYPGLIKAFESAALEKGFEVLLCTTNYDLVRTDNAFRKMIENKSPGVAVMTSPAEVSSEDRLDCAQFRPRFVGNVVKPASAGIPITAVAGVAFDLVQDGVNPGRGGVRFIFLDEAMRGIPFVGQSQFDRFQQIVIRDVHR
jgi:DNA-binding LacI/PurR family transcriptional regulator